jgi:hypothetical protein
MLSYSTVLPEHLPDFYNYLLSYPENPPANVKDVLYLGTGEIRVKTDIAHTPQNSPEGFYLISVMGSEQAGLGGPNGALIRKVAVGRSLSNLQDVLVNIRQTLETH